MNTNKLFIMGIIFVIGIFTIVSVYFHVLNKLKVQLPEEIRNTTILLQDCNKTIKYLDVKEIKSFSVGSRGVLSLSPDYSCTIVTNESTLNLVNNICKKIDTNKFLLLIGNQCHHYEYYEVGDE